MATRADASKQAPSYLSKMTKDDVNRQPAGWKATRDWRAWLRSRPDLLDALAREVADHGGNIRREFVHSYSDQDPVALFYLVMAWGFAANNVRWPGHRALLEDPPQDRIAAVVAAVQAHGADAGWRALHDEHRIRGLGYGFGTKLLYFGGYNGPSGGPKPLILDSNVLCALHEAGVGILADGDVLREDYMHYLDIAEQWGADPAWDVEPDVVEYALYERGRRLKDRRTESRRAYRRHQAATDEGRCR